MLWGIVCVLIAVWIMVWMVGVLQHLHAIAAHQEQLAALVAALVEDSRKTAAVRQEAALARIAKRTREARARRSSPTDLEDINI